MKKYVPLDKRTKKAQKEYNTQHRHIADFNTGTRDMKTAKLPTRAMNKETFRKELREWD